MLKLCDTLWENKITGVKKKYNSADESTIMSAYTEVDRPENADANSKDNIIIHFEYFVNPKTVKYYVSAYGAKKINQANRQTRTYPELQELVKVFDERTAEVFKKYDLLKSLND